MSNQNQKISIFDYTDYRVFLSDYYNFQKKQSKAFSYRYFAQKVNLKSSGYYKELVDGKRNLSRTLMVKFFKALKLNKKESEYSKQLTITTP